MTPGFPPRVVVVGAGAAGLAAAIFAKRAGAHLDVTVLDGARTPGAKILVSGGSRCNVTNTKVSEADFNSNRPAVVRRVLRALPVERTAAFFAELGVKLHEEPGGKLFPDTNRSRDVLNALMRELESRGATLRASTRVRAIVRHGSEGFALQTSAGEIQARYVVMATGGLSLPKTGSDGAGLEMVRALGHSIVPTTPALVPLVLDDSDCLHTEATGVSHNAELTLWVDARVAVRVTGSMLWTHFGISGPAALDMSRHYLRARLDRKPVALTLSFVPGKTFDQVDADITAAAGSRPRASLQSALAAIVPSAVATALLNHLQIDCGRELAHLTREDRRKVARALVDFRLPVAGSRGYNYAEVTAGGVPLDEIDASTMESRVVRGLYLTGEILDVDGRIGGFNFQWAWSSAFVAARALARSE